MCKPKKRRRRNDPNRKYAEQCLIERKNLKKKIWREDLAQPQRDPLTKLAKVFTLTTLSRIISMTTSSTIWILWFDQRTIYQPLSSSQPSKNLTNRSDISVFRLIYFQPPRMQQRGREEKTQWSVALFLHHAFPSIYELHW